MKTALIAMGLILTSSLAPAAIISIPNSSSDAYYAGTTNVIQPGGTGYACLYGSGHDLDLFPSGKADFPRLERPDHVWGSESWFGLLRGPA